MSEKLLQLPLTTGLLALETGLSLEQKLLVYERYWLALDLSSSDLKFLKFVKLE